MASSKSKSNIQEFLQALAYKNVTISVVGNKLRMQAPKGVLTPEIRRELLARKAEILRFYKPLQEIESSTSGGRRHLRSSSLALPKYVIPLSFTQEEIWFQEMIKPDTASYHVALGVEFTGHIDESLLQTAFQHLLSHYPILRMSVRLEDFKPHPVSESVVNLSWETRDLSQLSGYQRDGRRDKAIRTFLLKPFELDVPPLFRMLFVKIEEDRVQVLINAHRLIADEESLERMFNEAGVIYQGLKANQIPTPPISDSYAYTDFAAWQMKGYRRLEQQSVIPVMWRKRLAAAPREIQLPSKDPDKRVDRNRPYQTERVQIGFAPSLAMKLVEDYSYEVGGLESLFLTAFAYVLYRNSLQPEIPVGLYISHRHGEREQVRLGNFENIAPIFFSVEAGDTVLDTLERMAAEIQHAFTHMIIPFGKIIEPIMAETAQMINEVLPIRMRVRKQLKIDPALDEFSPRYLQHLKQNGMSDSRGLFLDIWQSGGALSGYLEYNASNYEAETVAHLVHQTMYVIKWLVEHPHEPMGNVPIDLQTVIEKQLMEWNNTEIPFPNEALVHELFENQARRFPHQIALKTVKETYTFREINQQSNQIARYLQEQGIKPLSKVAILISPSVQTFTASIAVLKCSAILVPLSHLSLELDAYQTVIDENQVDYLIIDNEMSRELHHAGPLNATVMNIDEVQEGLSDFSTANLRPMLKPNEPFAILIDPHKLPDKTIATHQGVINHLNWIWRTFELTGEDRAVYLPRPGHVDAGWEMFGGLLRGISTLVLSFDVLHDRNRFIKQLAEHEISFINVSPQDASWLLDNSLQELESIANALPTLKTWFMIGNPGDAHLIQALREEIPDRRMVLLYKSLKVVGTMLWRDLEPDWTPSHGYFRLGRPIDNMHVYILNDENVPLGVGGIGEVVVSGVGVSLDWYQASNFVVDYENDHPLFKSVPGVDRAVGFRTGDLGRFAPNGEIEFIGRKANMVLVTGQMVDLNKMEARLRDYETVLDGTVIYKPATAEGEPGQLHAYLALDLSENLRKRGESLYSQDINDWLIPYFGRANLPESYFLLSHIPRLPDQSIDIESLLEETAVTHLKDRPPVPPRSETEEKIAEIWRDLLLIDEVGVQDHFFDLGGDYMLALEMGQRVCAAFRVPFRFGAIYRNMTIERISFIVNKRQTRTKIKIVR